MRNLAKAICLSDCFNFPFRNFNHWIRWHQNFFKNSNWNYFRIPTGFLLEYPVKKTDGLSSFLPGAIKFIYSEKATKVCEICTVDLSYVVTVKSTVEICKILWPSQNIWTLKIQKQTLPIFLHIFIFSIRGLFF